MEGSQEIALKLEMFKAILEILKLEFKNIRFCNGNLLRLLVQRGKRIPPLQFLVGSEL